MAGWVVRATGSVDNPAWLDFNTEIPQPGVGKSQSQSLGGNKKDARNVGNKKIPASLYHQHKRIKEKQKEEGEGAKEEGKDSNP